MNIRGMSNHTKSALEIISLWETTGNCYHQWNKELPLWFFAKRCDNPAKKRRFSTKFFHRTNRCWKLKIDSAWLVRLLDHWKVPIPTGYIVRNNMDVLTDFANQPKAAQLYVHANMLDRIVFLGDQNGEIWNMGLFSKSILAYRQNMEP